jgi:hypothetical protein
LYFDQVFKEATELRRMREKILIHFSVIKKQTTLKEKLLFEMMHCLTFGEHLFENIANFCFIFLPQWDSG